MFTELDTSGGQLQKYSIQQNNTVFSIYHIWPYPIYKHKYLDTYLLLPKWDAECVKRIYINTITGYNDVLLFLFRASGRDIRECGTNLSKTEHFYCLYICAIYVNAFIFNADGFFMADFPRKKWINKIRKIKRKNTHNFLISGSSSSSHKNKHK